MSIAVPTSEGRSLEVLVSGPETGFPLVYHHGSPMSAVPFPLLEGAAAERNLRVIGYSRPGYGESSPRPTGVIADDVIDVTAILDHLGLGEFVTLGWSGGGPRALACAALLPGRCRGAVSLAGVAPFDAEGLDFFAGMGEQNVEEFGAAAKGPQVLEAWLAEVAPELFSVTADQVAGALGDLASDIDKAALTGGLAEYLSASTRHAGRQGITGWRDEDLVFIRPWGFDLGTVSVPVSIWQGRHDNMVPYAHGVWLAEHVAGARAHLYDDEGHLSLVSQLGRILDDLLDQAGVARASEA
jgi:pimeloyl-ACP methyl ester carboxylesterase